MKKIILINTDLIILHEFLYNNRNERQIDIYFDIETLKYNTSSKKPTLIKSRMYSFAIGFIYKKKDHVIIFNNFMTFHNEIKKSKFKGKINLIAQNNNKFDNHFISSEIIMFKNPIVTNKYDKHVIADIDMMTVTEARRLHTDIILEKRVRSMSSLEFTTIIDGIEYNTTDIYPKTSSSLGNLSKQLVEKGLLNEEFSKTDGLKYDKFDLDEDKSDEEIEKYLLEVFNKLNTEEIKYMANDIFSLIAVVRNYNVIYPDFDFNKITRTQNIKDSYLINETTRFQLLKEINLDEKGKDKFKINYTDYKLREENLFDILKKYFKGGLNFYNQNYLAKLLKEEICLIDLNSSYPYIMYKFKIPTFMKKYTSNYVVNIDYENVEKSEFSFYTITKKQFNKILNKIESIILKQMLCKYYNNNSDYVYINTNTFKILKDICHLRINKIHVLDHFLFDCEYFGAKTKIDEYYFNKTQGKNELELDYENPLNIKETNNLYKGKILSPESQYLSKVNLNGIFGLPALSPFFNLGYRMNNHFINVANNGFKNNERNIIFSSFVTSQALYNLLEPLQYLTSEEISDNFIYCDTDSLFLKEKIMYKIPEKYFHKYNLGAWDIEAKITKMYVLNHKKYCYEKVDKKNKIKLICKAGGIRQQNLDLEQSIESFINNTFHHKSKLTVTRSVMNTLNTITIYDGKMELEKGEEYPTQYTNESKEVYNNIKNDVENNIKNNDIMALYYETNFGSISNKEIIERKQEIKNKLSIKQLIQNFKIANKLLENYY